MGDNLKTNLLKCLGNIFEGAKDCKLEECVFDRLDADLLLLAEYLETSKVEAFFFAQIFVLNYKGNTVDINDLVNYFQCNPMKLLEYSDIIVQLNDKGYLKNKRSSNRVDVSLANNQFVVNEQISEAILNNLPIPNLANDKIENIIEVLELLYNIGLERDNGDVTVYAFYDTVVKILDTYDNFPLIKKVSNLKFSIVDTYLYLYLIWKTVNGKESVDIGRAVVSLFSKPSAKVAYMQQILSNQNDLIKANLVDIEPTNFFNDSEMKLSSKSIKMVEDEGLKLYSDIKKPCDLILPASIKRKELFFNDKENTQLAMLRKMLDSTNLNEIQQRLDRKNLPTGVTVLLYGLPGTGKTESVYQIARETGREIIPVDISSTKSMFFGESEKIVKKLFTEYREYACTCPHLPILLFNEADAIISKRKDSSASNLAQTENAIQNIILEELEKFNGIFIATTNLVSNMDSAFERRFLFKVEFQNPDKQVMARIWESKIGSLPQYNYQMLAEKYNFSGGQIDNILKKCEMCEIVYGKEITINDILEFCDVEQIISKNRSKIGF